MINLKKILLPYLNGEKVVASGASVVVVKGVGGLVGGNGDLWGALEGL